MSNIPSMYNMCDTFTSRELTLIARGLDKLIHNTELDLTIIWPEHVMKSLREYDAELRALYAKVQRIEQTSGE